MRPTMPADTIVLTNWHTIFSIAVAVAAKCTNDHFAGEGYLGIGEVTACLSQLAAINRSSR